MISFTERADFCHFWEIVLQGILSVSPCCGICSVTKQPSFCLHVFREMRDKRLVRWCQRWVQPSFSHTHPRTIWEEAGDWGNHFLFCLHAYLMQWCMWCCRLLRRTEARNCIRWWRHVAHYSHRRCAHARIEDLCCVHVLQGLGPCFRWCRIVQTWYCLLRYYLNETWSVGHVTTFVQELYLWASNGLR